MFPTIVRTKNANFIPNMIPNHKSGKWVKLDWITEYKKISEKEERICVLAIFF